MKSTAKLVFASAGGFFLGYLFGVNGSRSYYNEEIQKVVEQYRDRLQGEERRLQDRYEAQLEEYEREMDAEVQKAAKALTSYQTGEIKEEKPVDESEAVIISDDMFLENEGDYEQYTLTHYRGDDVLATQSDEIIGKDVRWAWFGSLVGTASPVQGDVMYIRNHKFRKDFEIVIVSGSFKDVVGAEAHE